MFVRDMVKLACAVVAFQAASASTSGQAISANRQTFRDPTAIQLRAAIQTSNVEAVEKLTRAAGTNDCLELDEQGQTALHYAVRSCAADAADPKTFEILKLLVRRPGCVNAGDRQGRKPILELQPLSWGSRSKMDTLSILIAAGADLNAQDENGATLLHQLLRVWDVSSVHLPEVVEILAKGGINPNVPDSAGKTPMHLFFGPKGFCSSHTGVQTTQVAAAQRVFALLMAAGANLSIPNHEGTTPVGEMLGQYEVFFGTKETILGFTEPALAKALAINTARIENRPALIYLCDKALNDPALITRLLDLGADAKASETDGFTALHGAAWFYNYQVCNVLIARGADVNAITQQGRTPLHELARSTYRTSSFFDTDRHADVRKSIQLLRTAGANRALRDASGKTAVELLKPLATDGEGGIDLRELKKLLKP